MNCFPAILSVVVSYYDPQLLPETPKAGGTLVDKKEISKETMDKVDKGGAARKNPNADLSGGRPVVQAAAQQGQANSPNPSNGRRVAKP